MLSKKDLQYGDMVVVKLSSEVCGEFLVLVQVIKADDERVRVQFIFTSKSISECRYDEILRMEDVRGSDYGFEYELFDDVEVVSKKTDQNEIAAIIGYAPDRGNYILDINGDAHYPASAIIRKI